MTDKGTWAKPTNALEIADELLEPVQGFPAPTQLEQRAADALRRQHQIILTLEAAQAQAAVEPVAWMLDAPKHPGAYLHKCNETDYEIERLSVFLKDGTLMVGSDIGTMDVAHYHAGLTDPMWAEIDIPPNHVAAMRLALEHFHKLACLGNGDQYGNSTGNVIAQAAIAALEGALK